MVIARLIIILVFILPTISVAAVTTTVDRNIIEEGETFQLVIRYDEGDPDIEPLKINFSVAGTATSSQVSIVNGKINSVKELTVSLVPKTMGTFVIPPIVAGSEASAPIRIEVKKPSFVQAQQGENIFLEAKADVQSTYVQSQVIYTVRLFRAVEIREGSLTEPDLSNAVVERLGEDVTFQTRRNGRLYQVTERRFAIFPQESGEFTIDPTVFQGQVLEPRTNRGRSNDPFDRFFQNQRTKRVRVKSKGLEITVNPKPLDADGENWLPAKRLILTESWQPDPPVFKVGEPVTRTLRIEAEGLTAAQLPEIKPFSSDGIKQYADQPMVETVLQNGALIGVREEKFAIVPTQSGKLVLPEIRLHWWNTEMNLQEIITLPPKEINVEPGEVAETFTSAPAPVIQPAESAPAAEPIITKEVVKTVIEAGYWPIVAISVAIMWILTGLGWFIYWQKTKVNSRESSSQNIASIDAASLGEAMKLLKQACSENNPSNARAALIAWVKAAWPDNTAPSLSYLADKLQDPTLNQSLKSLNQALYASDGQTWDGGQFWEVANSQLDSGLKTTRTNSNNAVKSLPELYPQN